MDRSHTLSEIEAAEQQDKVGFLPTVEHLAIGNELNRVDVLYNAGIRLAGMTYSRKAYIGDGIFERNDGGLSEFGVEVVGRMTNWGWWLTCRTRRTAPPWMPSGPPSLQ